jgi:hypothetical protein
MNLSTFKPSYLFKRLRMSAFQRKLPDAPWLTESAVYLLNSWLKPTDEGFEWGSGRSTIWLVERSAHIVSIEHHQGWYENVKSQLEKKGLHKKVDYFQIDEVADYENKIDEYDKLFDYILIDGRRRLHCFRKAISKVKPGGLLILDNSDRYIPNKISDTYLSVVNESDSYRNSDWQAAVEELGTWRQIQTSDGINDTTFWVKPDK